MGKTKNISEYTKRELAEMENFVPKTPFTGVVIVPMDEVHDSGYRCMKYVFERHGDVVGALSGWSDVLHIDGVGGFGKDWRKTTETRLVPVAGWAIDCLPKSRCLRLFSSGYCILDEMNCFCSDFSIYSMQGG